jgi:hypothetical protein
MKTSLIEFCNKIKYVKSISFLLLLFVIVSLTGCGNVGKPALCDCKIVEIGAFGPDPAVRSAAARIIGNDDAIDNPDRASRQCQLEYFEDFKEWKKSHDPNRSWTGDWQEFFTEKCK